jgi:hypothetical protein
MIGGGSSQVVGGEFHPGQGWTTSTLTDATAFPPAVTLTSATAGVGLLRSNSNSGELRYLTWSPGSFSAPAAIAAGVTTRATPSITQGGGTVSAVFQGDDFKHYFAGYVASWSPTAEPVGGSANQSFGPSPATLTALGSSAVVAFAGNDGNLYDQTRAAGSWQAADGHGLSSVLSQTPTVVALASGPDLMIVFSRTSDSAILYTTRTGGTWTTPAVTDPTAFATGAVSVAPLAGGGAVMVFEGTDTKVYWSLYTPSASTPWSQPAALASPNFTTPSPPSVAPGVGGVDAELVFVDSSTGLANHARLTGSTWSAPAVIGGSGLIGVAVASHP